MTQATLPFDITARRHRGNPESVAAHKSIAPVLSELRARVYNAFLVAGELGATSKEISGALGIPLHSISGRITELKALGYLIKTAKVRDGAAVLRVKEAVR